MVAWSEGLIAVLLPDAARRRPAAATLRRLRESFGDRAYLALTRRFGRNDQLRLHAIADRAAASAVPTVATNDVLFHRPDRRMLQDVVTCIRHDCTIDDAGFRRERHADRYLKRSGGDGTAVRALSRGARAHDRDRRALPLLARRARLPISRARSAMPGLTAAGRRWSG